MTSRFLVGMLLTTLLIAPPLPQRGSTEAVAQRGARFPRNATEFDELFRQVSNWGRWGKEDQLGSANLVTDAKRKQATALVKSGTVISLAHNPLVERSVDNPNPFENTMTPPAL